MDRQGKKPGEKGSGMDCQRLKKYLPDLTRQVIPAGRAGETTEGIRISGFEITSISISTLRRPKNHPRLADFLDQVLYPAVFHAGRHTGLDTGRVLSLRRPAGA